MDVQRFFERVVPELPRLRIVARRLRPGEPPDDLVDEAIERLAAGDRTIADDEPDVFYVTCGVMMSIASHAHRDAAQWRRRHAGTEAAEAIPLSLNPARLLEEREEEAGPHSLSARVRARIVGDELALTIFDNADGIVVSIAAQAERYGKTPEEIRRARKRILYAIEKELEKSA